MIEAIKQAMRITKELWAEGRVDKRIGCVIGWMLYPALTLASIIIIYTLIGIISIINWIKS